MGNYSSTNGADQGKHSASAKYPSSAAPNHDGRGAPSPRSASNKYTSATPSGAPSSASAAATRPPTFASATPVGATAAGGPPSTGAGGDDDYVSAVFKWEGGGKNVLITGTFNNWGKPIPMHKSGNDFSYIHNVRRGKHAFRFVVDDEVRYSPDIEHYQDSNGQMINFIDVTDFTPYLGDDNFFEKSKEQKLDEADFHVNIPDLVDYTKEPPGLPPHLRHIILNKSPPGSDQMSLPAPQHVSLNHLYCTAIKDGMMVLGSTHRYKEKFFTVVFYAMMPPSTVPMP